MAKHLLQKAIDTARAVREGSFSAVQGHYGADYAERMDNFAQTERYRTELRAMVKALSVEPDTQLLDFGCNTGRAMEMVRDWTGCTIRGIDQNDVAVEIARNQFPEMRFDTYSGSDLPYRDGSFDAVMVNHVLGHVPDPQQTLSEIFRVLAPKGRVGIVTPNKYYKLGMVPLNILNDYRPDPTVLRYYSIKELRRELQSAGFSVQSLATMGEIVPWLRLTGLESFRIRVFALGQKEDSS